MKVSSCAKTVFARASAVCVDQGIQFAPIDTEQTRRDSPPSLFHEGKQGWPGEAFRHNATSLIIVGKRSLRG